MAVNDLFEFDDFLSDIVEITRARSRRMIKSFTVDAIIVVDHLKPDAKEEAKCIHKLLEKADNYAIRAADYFQKGLTLRRWRQDAFLNFYKANELIFDKYFGEADASELERKFDKPKGELTTKEKMKYMCEKLSIEQKLLEKVDNIVDIRSSQDVAHAKLTEPEMNQEDIDACREMAKQTILNYLLTLQNTDGT